MTSDKTRVRTRRRIADLTHNPLGMVADDDVSSAQTHSAPLSVAYVPVDQLRETNRKLRRYSKRHRTALKASIKKFGMLRPVLVDKDNTIIAGAAVWLVAKELKHETIPVIRIEHLSPAEVRLYRLADNKLQMGEFVETELRLEFLELSDLAVECNFDFTIEDSAFATQESDALMLREPPKAREDSDEGGDGGNDDEVEFDAENIVTRPGDLWLIGPHRARCGNSLELETYAALMGDERAQMVVADGPYNVPIKGNVSSREDAKEFAFGSGEMDSAQFISFQRTVFAHLVQFSIDGSIHYHFMSWHCAYELLAAGREEYTELKNMLVWAKTNAGRGFYRSQHELCFVFKAGPAPHICTFGIEKGARWRSNVIVQAGCNSFGPTRDDDLADHPTVKPLPLIADLLRDCSTRGGIVLDPWGGSGTTLLAAEWTGRRARLIEIEPGYVDVTIRRAAKRFGLTAVLEATGQTFEEVMAERIGADEESKGNDFSENGAGADEGDGDDA